MHTLAILNSQKEAEIRLKNYVKVQLLRHEERQESYKKFSRENSEFERYYDDDHIEFFIDQKPYPFFMRSWKDIINFYIETLGIKTIPLILNVAEILDTMGFYRLPISYSDAKTLHGQDLGFAEDQFKKGYVRFSGGLEIETLREHDYLNFINIKCEDGAVQNGFAFAWETLETVIDILGNEWLIKTLINIFHTKFSFTMIQARVLALKLMNRHLKSSDRSYLSQVRKKVKKIKEEVEMKNIIVNAFFEKI